MAKLTKAQRRELNRLREQDRQRQRQELQNQAAVSTAAPDSLVIKTEGHTSNGSHNLKKTDETPQPKAKLNWELVFSGCLTLFALVSVVVSIIQWDTMVAQNDEMILQREEMAEQTQELIETNRIARQQVSEMTRQNDAILEQTKLARGQLEIAESQVEQARTEQRAWISFYAPKITDIVPDEKFSGAVVMRNTGPTPGTIASSFSRFSVVDGEDGVDEEVSRLKKLIPIESNVREMVLVPGADMTMPIFTGIRFDQTSLQQLREGSQTLMLFCHITYVDITKALRTTQCCYVYNTGDDESKSKLATFSRHNQMD
jgi:hypothetical protein